MCLTLFTHYCLAKHETRPLCNLNPATDCTVLNPYAEPWRNPCPASCLANTGTFNGDVSVIPGHRCPWHGDCCRLVRSSLCGAFEPSQCPNDIAYHLRREPTEGVFGEAVDDLARTQFPPLPVFNEEPWFVALRWDFFQAASDLHNVGARRASYAAAVKKQARHRLLPSWPTKQPQQRGGAAGRRRKEAAEAERRCAETGRKYRTIAHYLGQLAQVWDRNAAYGLCPPRPGWQPDPALAWPGYAQVGPAGGVWSIGYELVHRVRNAVVRPPAHQEVFKAHHLPQRVGIPTHVSSSSSSSSFPSGAWDGNAFVKTKIKSEDEDVEMASAPLAPAYVYPPPPSPPPASYANTTSTFVTPFISTLSLSPLPGSGDYAAAGIGPASLERHLAAEDASITGRIREAGETEREQVQIKASGH